MTLYCDDLSPPCGVNDVRDGYLQSRFLVVFVDQTECRYLSWLKRGFRHCFVAMRHNNRWVICDSLKNRIEIYELDLPAEFELSEFYCERGYTVLIGDESSEVKPKAYVPEVLTCVTVAKRILGLRSFWTLTPWQLFCLLHKDEKRWRLAG